MTEVTAEHVAPRDLGEAETLLAAAAARGDTVAFVGGATELGFGYPAERIDLLVDTKGLARIVDYAPADMVVEAEAGITLAALQNALAPNRQRLALDPPYPELATIRSAPYAPRKPARPDRRHLARACRRRSRARRRQSR
jgi:FAD/FMN-containing dehydrogenase